MAEGASLFRPTLAYLPHWLRLNADIYIRHCPAPPFWPEDLDGRQLGANGGKRAPTPKQRASPKKGARTAVITTTSEGRLWSLKIS
jgi:hypothetical protein